MAGERILVIDDDRQIRTVLRDMMEPLGYRVATARDGQEGLEYALREHPDLILTDVNMPRMTGLEFLQKLRDTDYEWPVILMTVYGSEQVAVQAFRLGVHDYLRKPLKVEEVLNCVERALVESRLRREKEELLGRLADANRQLNHQVAELRALYAIGQAVTSVLDLDKLLNRVVEASVYLCHADEGTLYLIEKETGELYAKAEQGMGEKAARGVRFQVNDSLVGQVVQTGKPTIIRSQTLRPELKIMTGYMVHSLVNVPLGVKNTVIGVLSVANRIRHRDFTQADVNRLKALGNYAAIAIENARLYEAARRLVAAEVLKNTVVTISHYINNPLMSLMVNVDRMAQECKDSPSCDIERLVAETARFTEMKVEEISSVIAILRDLASPQFVTYLDNIKMIDIEAKVQERLQYIKEKYKG